MSIHLTTRDEFLANVKLHFGSVTITDAQIISSLNLALSQWGDSAKVPFCYTQTTTCGVCEYDLPCCDACDLELYFKDNCSCDCPVPVVEFEVRCDKIKLPSPLPTGTLTIVSYTAPPQQPLVEPKLAANYASGATTMVIGDDLGQLPPSGWLHICGDWYSYKCWKRVTVTPERINIADASGAVANINPTTLRDVDACGVYTVLSSVEAHCSNTAKQSHTIGKTVSLGIATSNQQAYAFLLAKTLSGLFTMQAMACTSDQKIGLYLQLAEAQDKRAMELLKRRPQTRKARTISHAFVHKNHKIQYLNGLDYGNCV